MYDILLPAKDVLDHLGRDRIGIIRFHDVYRVEHPHCQIVSEFFKEGEIKCQRNILHTPKGDLEEVRVFDPVYDSSTARIHYVKSRRDYEILWSYLEDSIILDNTEQYYKDVADLGEDGLVMPDAERTPWQQLWISWAGLEALSLHLVDFPDHVEHTVELLKHRARQIFEVAYRSPSPFIDICDNITAPAIGPLRFRKYCIPLYDELAGMLAERGAPLFVHMDGLLKPLWEDIGRSSVGGIESFTPVPDCDTTVGEAVSQWPRKILWVNFPSSVHLQSPVEIRATTEEILAAAGHSGRLQIQVSENAPLDVWRTSFRIIADTIVRFGKP